MKQTWRRFAPIGLWLALAAAVAAGVLYILQREWNLYLQISLALIVVGLALFAILDPERVRVGLTGRQARYGSNALVMSLAFLGILVVINYLVYKNPSRTDLTEDQENTLADETIATLEKLPENVEAQAFFTSQASPAQAQALLDQYKFAGKGKFDYRFIDPNSDPIAAQSAGITRDGTVVLRMGERTEPVSFVTERELTASLVRLMTTEKVGVYFLTGHGERNPNESGDESYASLKTTLESKNYQVDVLNLLASNQVPEDAQVIVIAGPRQPVSQAEVDLLKSFAAGGGALIVMEEPLPLTEFGDAEDPLAGYLSADWGITLGKDIIVDLSSQQPFVAVANEYGQHATTDKLQGLVTLFPTARSVQVSGETADFMLTDLVKTSNNSWAETDLAALQNSAGGEQLPIQPDQGVDLMGPVTVAVVAESASSGQRLAVFGDADFAVNANFNQYGNGDLLVNTIDWAAEQEELINLTPKETTQRTLVSPTRSTMGLILLGSVILLPGLMLVAGIVAWIQRRKRG
jgi:ABC-type uncharacterized transport system involved in gliding motility auxiliary subunit